MLNFRYKYTFGRDTTNANLPIVPAVVSSVISATQADGILVKWDRSMMMTCDVKAQIKVIIDGATEVMPDSIAFNPADRSEMGLIMATHFTVGQVVTWAYDDTGACDLQEIAAPNTEADNQTYSVLNGVGQVNLSITADSTSVTADSATIKADKG